MIETRGLVALVEGTDAMLKAANVELAGPMTQVGNALCTAIVVGDVAAVKAAVDAGAQAIKSIKGEVISDLKHRPEGIRVKHSVKGNSLKMYDKEGSVLRIETTINKTRGQSRLLYSLLLTPSARQSAG